MLPLKDQVGGLRMLFSHNVQFPLSQVHEADRTVDGDPGARVSAAGRPLRPPRAKRSNL